MNEQDRDNLDFLMNASEDVLKDWYFNVEQDDILYAFELLQLAAIELDDELVNTEEDCAEARKLLSKYMLQ